MMGKVILSKTLIIWWWVELYSLPGFFFLSLELYIRVNGDLQEYLHQAAPSRNAVASAPDSTVSHCWPTSPQETFQH